MDGYDELTEMEAGNRAARLEREAILAWLRPRIDQIDVGEQSEYGMGVAGTIRDVEELLDAIERGEHDRDD